MTTLVERDGRIVERGRPRRARATTRCRRVLLARPRRAHGPRTTRRCVSVFGFHPLAIEDSEKFGQRAKLEDYGDFAFLVVFGWSPDEDGLVEVHCFYSERYLVTVRHDESPALDELRRRYAQRRRALETPIRAALPRRWMRSSTASSRPWPTSTTASTRSRIALLAGGDEPSSRSSPPCGARLHHAAARDRPAARHARPPRGRRDGAARARPGTPSATSATSTTTSSGSARRSTATATWRRPRWTSTCRARRTARTRSSSG